MIELNSNEFCNSNASHSGKISLFLCRRFLQPEFKPGSIIRNKCPVKLAHGFQKRENAGSKKAGSSHSQANNVQSPCKHYANRPDILAQCR